MTHIPPIRQSETGSTDVEPAAVLRVSSPVRTAAAIATAAAVFLAVVVLAGVGRLDTSMPSFLANELGPEKAEAPLERTPATGVDVRIHDQGYTVSHWGVSVSVVSEDVGGDQWRRHVHGVTRDTSFGTETIVVNGRETEEFLTVTKRQGVKTWRWKLATRLHPRLGRDGSVTFLDPTRHRVTTIGINPVRILDGEGKDVTPDGLRWSLAESDSGWWLTLDLDDADLPLPYVIDPAVTHRAAVTATTTGATSLVLGVPAGVQPNDLLVAHIARAGNAAINTPTGWTAAGGTNNGSFIRQATYYRVAGSSEPGSYTWTWTGTQPAAGGMSAYYGVKASAPLDAVGAATTANNTTTVTAASITTAANDALVLAFFSSNTNSTYSTATGMSERYEIGTTGAASVATDDMTQPAAGATGSKTSTASTSGRVVGHQVSFNVDNVVPVGSLTDPGSPLAGTLALAATASDVDSAVASVLFQRSPANAGTWTDIGSADPTSPYAASFDTTAVADGLYDLRVVITDVASNVTISMIEDRLVDNTAPASTTTFPAASGTYNAASWAAGCTTIGLCGTYSDAGSGVSQVQISLRQGSGNYWNGSGFSSGAEVWNSASLSAGDWSYAFNGAGFPAAGSYTVRVRAVDGAGNLEGPASRTFTIDPDAPQTTIDSNPSTPTSSTSADFGFSSSEGGSTFECRLDGGAWAACTSPKSYTSLADGSHTFDVRATDAAGNQDASPASYTWLVDTTAPSSTTTFPAASGEYNATGWGAGCGTVGLCGTYSDGTGSGVAQVQVSIRQGAGNYWNGSSFASGAEVWNNSTVAGGNWSYAFAGGSFPADGGYTVRVRAVDAVANTEAPSSRTFTYDTTNPSALFTFPTSGGDYTDTAWNAGCGTNGFCGTYSDSLSGVQVVQVSIQRLSNGLYWNGTSFASASEAYQAASLAGGNWSLSFPAANFPADGQYTVHVRARDDAQNTETGPSRTFRIDNTAPASTVTFPASAGTYNTSGWNAGCATNGFCGTHSDGGSGVAQVQVSIRQGAANYWNGTSFGSGAEVWNTATLAGGNWSLTFPAASFPADGSYTVRVRATDAAGNVETPSSRSFTIDRAAPQTTIDSNPSNPSSSSSATFTFSSSEGSSTFECRLDGGSWGACTSPADYTSLTEGSHTFDVRATDVAANVDASPASYTWAVDTVAPTSTVSFPASAGTYNTAGWNTGCGTSGVCGTYSDGTGSSVAQVQVSIRQGAGNYWNGTSFGSGTEVWNNGTIAGGNWSLTFPAASFPVDDTYTVRVRALDNAANTETPSSRSFTIDRAAPQTTIDSNPPSQTSSTSASFDFSSSEGSSTFECRIDGGAWSACTSPKSYASLTDGSHTFDVRATDAAGNTDGTPATYTWLVDTAAPSSTIGFPVASASYTASEWAAGCATAGLCGTYSDGSGAGVAAVEVSIQEGGGDYWDGSGFSSSTEVWNDADLAAGDWSYDLDSSDFPADGDYTVRVRARDDVGNTEAPSSRTFEVDKTDPSSALAFPGAAGIYNPAGWDAGCPAPGLCGTYFDATSGVAEVEVSIQYDGTDYWDGSGFSSSTEVWNDADLAAGDWSYDFPAANLPVDGEYAVRVRAKDAAGNVEPASSGTFTFDASEPETTIDSSMPDPTNSSSASFDFSADELGATFECAIDGGAWDACASPKAYTGLSDGGHNFEVRATDPAGNTDDSPSAFNWTIDTVDPTSTASFPAASGRYTAAEWDAGCTAPGLCGTYSDSGVGVVDVEVSIRRGNGNYWTGSGFSSATEVWNDATLAAGDWTYGLDSTDFPADGSYTVRVRARDDAGNTETPSSRTFDFDATAPSSTLAFPAAAGTYNAAGWAAGCATDGLCGSYADGSTGVAEVEVSIRRGTGNYWNGSGFSSATEVWNDATLAAGDWTYGLDSTDFPADGGYTVRFRATDVAGNTESASSRTFTYDTTAPQTTIDSSPTDPTSSTTAAFDVSANEGGSTFECSIDGGAWSACTSPKSYTSLTDGSHTFDVRATDQAGNTDGTPASFTWLVDTTAPSSTTSFPAPGGEYNAAGWDAGCATSGLCGTYGDGSGSGVAEVEVSIRRGNGNYWTGTGFSSATEVWNDATLAAGDWTYEFDSGDFPADGSYTVRVRATDDVGNVETPSSRTLEYDTTDPSALFAFPTAGGEYRTSVWNTGCATVGLCGPQSDSGTGVSDVEVSVQRVSDGLYWDGDSFDAGTESWFAASLASGNWSYPFAAASFPADGQYVVQVRAIDDAGNTEAGPSRTFRIDNTDPSALVTFPAAGTRYSTAGWDTGCATSGLCGTQSDSGSGIAQVEVSLKRVSTDLYWDGDSFDAGGETYFTATLAGGNWSYAFPAGNFPADGDYTLHVRATDDAGNTEGGPTRTFTYDTRPPQTTIDANPADPTASTSGSFDLSSDEGSSTFECRIDGGAWNACTSPKSYTSLADGSHTFDVRATDVAGNTDGSPATYTWLVDTAAPSSTIGFPAASGEYNVAGWNAGCATSGLCGTYSDGSGSGVDQVRVSVRRVSTGLYWNGASFSSAPEVVLNTGLAGGNWTRAFPASNFPADGDYTVSVFATDDVANAEAPSALTFHFDATDPTGSLTAPADGAALRGSSVTVASDSADAGSGVDSAEFQRRPAGGGAWTTIATDTNAPYAANWDTTSLADGDHELRVITTDAAGNTFTSATRTVTVDNTAPSAATLDTLPAAIRNGQGLTGSGSDATSGVDSLTYLYCVGTSCSPSTPIGSSTTGPGYTVAWASQPADGDVRVRVRVADSAGNSLDSAVQGVEVDNTNPTGSLTAPADASVLGGNSVTVSSDSADTGSGVDSAEFQRRPAGGGAWTTIATDTNAPYAANWDTTSLADGDHELRVITTDAAGNTFTSATRTVTVDNSDPTVTITAPTSFVNGAAADPFTVTATTPDDDVAGIELFRCSNASTGCSTGSWVSLGVDASPPYSALWTIDADGNRALRAVATDGAGITGSDLVDITIDRTNPTGSLTAPADGSFVTGTVIVSSDSADTGSGVDSAEFQRRPAGGGAWTTIATDTNAPYAANWDTTSLADGDHELRVITTDAAGNTFTSATRTVTVDNTAPSAPLVTLVESSPFAHVNGSEIFVNTDETGMYDVQATSSDAHSGIDKVRFPGPTDDSSSPYETSYGLGDLSGGQSVTAFNGVGLTASSPFTVTPDTTEPSGGSVGYASGYDADGDVAITVDAGTDALSGLAAGSAVLERRTASLADGTCDPFAGVWSTVTSPDTIASGLCAQYRYRVADRVGNEAVYTSAHVVKVDLVNPAAPVLTLDESSPYAHVVGTEIFVNTSQSGSYDVGASTSDAVSGIDKVVFPGGVEDTSAPYSATYDFDDLGGTETVTAHDRAGNTGSSDFEVTEDVTAPSTTDDTASIGSAWQTAPVTVTLSPTDGRSGVAETYYTTDGSVPTTSSPEGTEIDLTADGVYVIHYFSIDNVGNAEPVRTALVTIRIDQTDPGAPSISLSESSPYAHVAGSEIFVNTAQTGTYDVSATSSDAGSGIARIVFPNGVEDTTSPYAATYDLDDLSGSQTVTAHDAAGNTASDTFTVTPDTAAPAGGSVSYPDGYDADGTVTVTVDAGTDALSGVDASSGVLERDTSALAGGVCDPFAGAWITVTSPDTVASGLCAQYRYRVADRVGNEVIYTLPTSTAKVDLVAPQTTIDGAPGNPSADASPSFDFSSNELASTFECRLDGGAWGACTSPRSYASLTDGNHAFQVRATDAAGLTDATPASHTWAVDTAAPDTTLDDSPTDPSNDDAPSFDFSASEPGATFECRLDGGAWAVCTSPETVGLLADGSHLFQVRAVDAADNVDPSPASHAWTVDTVAPDSSFTVVPSDPTSDTTPTFEFTATEAGSTFQCRLDGGAWGPCSSPATIGPLPDGSHTYEVRATDAAGNQETAPESYTWLVDAGTTSVSITQPSGFVNAADSDPYTVTATSPDGDVTGVELFSCSDASTNCSTGSWVSLGTDTVAPYEASWPVDADGNRALRAVATDAASNTGSAVVNVTIDRTVPATSLDSAPADPSPSAGASFAFSSNEGGASFECRLDGGGWGACSSPKSYAGLGEGNHTFHVRATDAAGNVDPTPATFAWTVDTVAPQATIDVAPSDPSGSSAPTFEFSSSEGSSSFQCRLDGGAWGACASPHGYTGLADGSHAFQVRAIDAAGNVDGTPAAHTWTIDATAPGGGLADPGEFLRGVVALTASPSDSGAGVQSVEFQVSPANADSWAPIDLDTTDPYSINWDTALLVDGAYDLRVVVTDNVGNSSPSAAVEDRIVDNTAPGATMNDPGANLRGTVSLTANASDPGSGVASVAFERSPAGAGTWTSVPVSWNTTSVADGLYDLRVIVTDNAGNSTTSAAVVNRRVDNTKPSLTSSTPVDGSTIASAGTLQVAASEDLTGIVGATIDGSAAPAPSVAGNTVTYTESFTPGPHTLAGELEDLAGNRQPIRVHFTTWSTVAADYPYVEKNSLLGATMSLRSTSDTTTVTVPAGAWSGAPAGDWLVLRIDPQPAAGGTNGFQPASEILNVTAYWALADTDVTSFSLPLQIEVDNTLAHAIPAVLENGSWRPIAQIPGSALPAAWNDGFEYDGSNVRIFTRHLSVFTLLEDAQAPTAPGGFKGVVLAGKFSLSWTAASDNSGLVSAYRIYANGAVVKTVVGSIRTVAMGKLTLTDKRAYQVAAVDEAGNVGPKTVALKVVPKVAKLTLAAAKTSLKNRGFKVGKLSYKASSTVAKGKVIAAAVSGLKPAGTKIGLTVSKGTSASRRPATAAVPTVPPTPPSAPTTGTFVPPTPSDTPSPTTTPSPTATDEESLEPKRGRVLPFVGVRAVGLSSLRQELGFGLLAAAFSIAVVAILRARRPFPAVRSSGGDPMLLWDQRILDAIRRFLRLS